MNKTVSKIFVQTLIKKLEILKKLKTILLYNTLIK